MKKLTSNELFVPAIIAILVALIAWRLWASLNNEHGSYSFSF